MNILLIEPDAILAHTYVAAFEQAGHRVARTASAQMAVQLADEQQPDIVVLELQLPEHNGVEFLYEFRSYPEWQSIPVIIHSFVRPAELSRAKTLTRELGVARVLHKPTASLASLCSAVRSCTSQT